MKEIIQLDMDDTIADFCGHEIFKGIDVNDHNCTAMYEPGFFLSLKPVEGALKAVRQLIRLGFDVQITTQPVAESPHSYAEKIQWLGMWFPELIQKVNMTQDKGLIRGDYLIDDRAHKWRDKFEAHGGKFVFFRYTPPWKDAEANKKEWVNIVEYFTAERERLK